MITDKEQPCRPLVLAQVQANQNGKMNNAKGSNVPL